MEKIKIITDSASDVPKEQERELDIRVLSFPITVEGTSYREREDLDLKEFYTTLENCQRIPTHAQITPMEFEEVYQQYYQEGYTDLIYISINAKGSSTYNNSVMARDTFYEEYPEAKEKMKIHLVDSQTYCMVYGYAVMEAADKAKRGASVAEILAYLDDWFHSAVVYFAPYDLKFVKKSGRVSAAAAFVGDLMGLKPILTFDHGDSKILGKVRGEKAVIPDLIKRAQQSMIPQTPYLVIGNNRPDRTAELAKEAQKAIGYPPQGIYDIGAVISINAGPKVVGIVFKGPHQD